MHAPVIQTLLLTSGYYGKAAHSLKERHPVKVPL